MDNNFKDHPVSLTEARANKEHDGTKWTPRDALINLLREIDNGKKVSMVIIGYAYEDKNIDPGYAITNFVNCTPSAIHSWGLWARVNYLLHDNKLID